MRKIWAKTVDHEETIGYNDIIRGSLKYSALRFRARAETEDGRVKESAEERLKTILDELASQEGYLDSVEGRYMGSFRFREFANNIWERVRTPEKSETVKAELKTWINRKISAWQLVGMGARTLCR